MWPVISGLRLSQLPDRKTRKSLPLLILHSYEVYDRYYRNVFQEALWCTPMYLLLVVSKHTFYRTRLFKCFVHICIKNLYLDLKRFRKIIKLQHVHSTFVFYLLILKQILNLIGNLKFLMIRSAERIFSS